MTLALWLGSVSPGALAPPFDPLDDPLLDQFFEFNVSLQEILAEVLYQTRRAPAENHCLGSGLSRCSG